MTGKRYLKTGKRSVKRVKYKKFSVGEEEKALCGESINCMMLGGGIYPAMETELFELDGLTRVVYGSSNGIMKIVRGTRGGTQEKYFAYVAGDGQLYVYDFDQGGFRGVGHTFPYPPETFCVYTADGKELTVFATEHGIVTLDYINVPKTVYWYASRAAFYFHDRIFVGYGNSLRYCAHQDYEDWTESADEGGRIDFPSEDGDIVGGAVIGEKCYLFFERGIKRLEATGAARDFFAVDVPYGGADIIEGSCRAVGKYVFFLTREGAMRFDGETVEQICLGMDIQPQNVKEQCESVVYEDQVYIKYWDWRGYKKFLVADVGRGKGYFLAPDECTGLSVSDGMLLCVRGERFAYFKPAGSQTSNIKRRFEVKDFDFGIDGDKLMKKVRIEGGGTVYLTIYGERGNREGTVMAFDLSSGADEEYPLVRGKRFSFAIELGEGGFVTALTAEIAAF